MTTVAPIIQTGLSLLDEHSILDPGQLIVLAGETGAGTTSLAMGLIAHACRQGPVLAGVAEMTAVGVLKRVAAIEGDMSWANINRSWRMTSEEFAKFKVVASRLEESHLHVLQGLSLERLEGSISTIRPKLAVVDSVEFFLPPPAWKGSRLEYQTYVANQLARMTREYKTIIILLKSLGRTGTASSPSNLASSGGVEENADQVWLLARRARNQSTLKITKNRGGMSYVSQDIFLDEKTKSFRNQGELQTGISILNETNILAPGQLISLIGEPGIGKTALVIGLVSRAYKSGTVLVNNVESHPTTVLRQLLVSEGYLPSEKLLQSSQLTAEEQANLEKGLARLSEAPIHITHTFDLGVLEKSIVDLHPCLVVIDYINVFLQPDDWQGTRGEYIAHLAKELARMARDHKTSIIVAEMKGRAGTPGNVARSFVEDSADEVWLLKYEAHEDGKRTILEIDKSRSRALGSQEIFLDEKTRTFHGSVATVA